MALDPRISLAVQAPNVTPAINLFNQAMQQKRANDLMPGQLELQQQQIQARQQANQAGALDLKNAKDAADLKSVAGFSALNSGAMDAALGGDTGQLSSALQGRITKLEAEGRDATQSREALEMIKAGNVKGAVSSFKAAEKLAERSGLLAPINAGLTDSQRKTNRIKAAIDGATDENGKLKPRSELTAEQEQAAIEAGLIPRAVGSAKQTIAESGNVEAVAGVTSKLAEAGESGKLEAQKNKLPNIKAEVKKAEIRAKETGETMTDLNRAKAALPGLTQVVDKLKELAPLTTSTFGGAVFDRASKELGFGSTKGATAKAKFVAMIDNQVLPLLRDTFGAAFTAAEGERLRDAMANPDASTDEKLAQLDAFISQKYRDIETKERALSGLTTNPEAQMEQPTNSGFKILSIE